MLVWGDEVSGGANGGFRPLGGVAARNCLRNPGGMGRLTETDPDLRLVQLGWWLVCAPGIVLFIGVIWLPMIPFGVNMTLWTTSELWVGLGAFFAGFLSQLIWQLWSRPRWLRWASSRASDLDRVKVHAMYDGVLRKDRRFIAEYDAKLATEQSEAA